MARGHQEESYFAAGCQQYRKPPGLPLAREPACLLPFPLPTLLCCPLCNTHLTLLNTMSMSVLVTAFPSITPHSLHILEKFFPVMSLPLAAVLPYTANLRKASSTAAILLLWRKEVVREGADDHLQPLATHSCPTHLVCSKARGTTHRYLCTAATATARVRTQCLGSRQDRGRDSLGSETRQRRAGGAARG